MAISTYLELKTALQAWVDGRSDVPAQAENFIALAEAHFNLELRCREMVDVVDLTPVAGVVTLPADFEGLRRVVEKSIPRRVLDYVSPDAADEQYDADLTGYPYSFTIIGGSLHTYPQATSDIELTYFKAITPLVDDGDTNWLLTKYPNIYLEAAQLEAYRFFKMDQDLNLSATRVFNMIERLNNNSMIEQYANAGRTNTGPTP